MPSFNLIKSSLCNAMFWLTPAVVVAALRQIWQPPWKESHFTHTQSSPNKKNDILERHVNQIPHLHVLSCILAYVKT